MQGFNKLIGGFLGFLLAGPGGCIFGILLGHIFDQNLNTSNQDETLWNLSQDPRTQKIFFEATFLLMGYIAKQGNRISERTIQTARQVMHHMKLNKMQRLWAIQLFNRGKKSQFDLNTVLNRLLEMSQGNLAILQRFISIQLEVILADASSHTKQKKQAFASICKSLGIDLNAYYWFRSEETYYDHEYTYTHSTTHDHNAIQLAAAFQILGISPKATSSEVKQAYRRAMQQHHPDRLAKKNLSPEQLQEATRYVQRIQEAYNKIRKERNFS
jgi:DnaJ like chaperone protein